MAISDGGMRLPGVQQPFRSLRIASSGLSGQRARIEAIASNIANAGAINTDGTPYMRKVAVLREVGFDPVLQAQVQGQPATGRTEAPGGVEVMGIEEVADWETIYDPSDPRADADGYVQVANIDVETEMIDLLHARRLYEANATVFEAVKGMLSRAAEI